MHVRCAAGALLTGVALLAMTPLRVSAASTVVIGNNGPFAVTVAPGTIIDVELTGTMSLGQPHPYAVPTSSNIAVLAPISGSTDSRARTHATFRALRPGSSTLSGSGPSGIFCPTPFSTPGPGCIAVAPILFRVAVTVSSGTTVSAPQTGGAVASYGSSGGGGDGPWILGAVVATAAGGLLGGSAIALRRRRAR